jgi:ABC-type multidrug transport system fused ATPase/permease subunit
MYAHLLELATPFKDKYATGDLLTRLAQDIIRVSEFLVLMPANLFAFGITIALYLGLLFYIDTWLAILTVILAPLIFFHQRFFIGRTRKTAHSFLTYQGSMGAFEEESMRNLQGIVSFSASKSMLERFDKLFAAFRQSAMRNLLLNNGFVVTFELLIAVAAILLVTVGVYRIEQNILTVGNLINFLLYLGYLSVPLRGLATVPIESQIRAVATQRVVEILDEKPMIIDKPDAISPTQIFGAITFKHVGFTYPDNTSVLKNININIKSGEHIAIMGPSGVGKSTFAKLLLRLYDPIIGCILLDGIDIRDIRLQALRAHIAVVWQDPFLIDDTIFANLQLCKPDATEQQMRTALRKAYAHEFIEKLPHGYDTHLGNQGAQLSTGQKQRIAIAQALLKQASVFILDEATSALDSHSESVIQQAIQALRGHCTVIVIAHRMSTIANVDRIVYFNNDGTATIGTHRELQNKHEDFRRALAHQSTIGAIA